MRLYATWVVEDGKKTYYVVKARSRADAIDKFVRLGVWFSQGVLPLGRDVSLSEEEAVAVSLIKSINEAILSEADKDERAKLIARKHQLIKNLPKSASPSLEELKRCGEVVFCEP